MPTELFVSGAGACRAVLREGGRTVEVRVEDPRGRRLGRIVKAKVTRLVPAIQSVFLDVGSGRDAFLHATDLANPAGEKVERLFRPGQSLLVQISRESPEGKGDRATPAIGLPGRLLVLLPAAGVVKVSRRIADEEERARLAAAVSGMGGDDGFVVRTVARGVCAEALAREAEELRSRWGELVSRADSATAPAVLREPPSALDGVLTDLDPRTLDRVVAEDDADHARLTAWVARHAPDATFHVERHRGERPLFESYGIEREIRRALSADVRLPSGGLVVIEPTEALVSIDVNTGRSVRGKEMEDTVTRTNLEAAVEIAHQLRLRDLGGIIVIDFIDMERAAHRREVVETFRAALARDPARTRICALSELGLLQMTRKRARRSLRESLTRACAACGGAGRSPRPDAVLR